VSFNTITEVEMTLAAWNNNTAGTNNGINRPDRLALATRIEDTKNASIRGSFYDENSKLGADMVTTGQYFFDYRIYQASSLASWTETSSSPSWTKVGMGTTALDKTYTWNVPLSGSAPDGATGYNYWIGNILCEPE